MIERSIDDWLSHDDKTIHYIMYADNKIAGKASGQVVAGSFCSLFCSWKASSSDDDQEYFTNLSTDRIHKKDHNASSELDVDKSKAKILNPPFVARTIGDWTSNLLSDATYIIYQNKRTGETMWEPPPGFEDDQLHVEYRTSTCHLQITSEDSELEIARKQLAIAKEKATIARTYEKSIQQVIDTLHKQLMRPAIDKTISANNIVKHAERELIETENRLNGVDGSVLQNELWIRSCSYLTESDLFALGQVSRKFLSISSTDELWKPICLRRWKKKQNVKRFMKKGPPRKTSGRQEYISGVLSRMKWFTRCDDPPTEFPALNVRSDDLDHIIDSWKESYIMAELDSRRKTISREEILHFKWKEIHGGRPGQMVQYLEDGTYTSPVHGTCGWALYEGFMYFGHDMERDGGNWEWRVSVERDVNNWGWIIGKKGQETMYRSAS